MRREGLKARVTHGREHAPSGHILKAPLVFMCGAARAFENSSAARAALSLRPIFEIDFQMKRDMTTA